MPKKQWQSQSITSHDAIHAKFPTQQICRFNAKYDDWFTGNGLAALTDFDEKKEFLNVSHCWQGDWFAFSRECEISETGKSHFLACLYVIYLKKSLIRSESLLTSSFNFKSNDSELWKFPFSIFISPLKLKKKKVHALQNHSAKC